MGSRAALLLWLGATGCSNVLGIQDVTGPADGSGAPPVGDAARPIDAPPLPACQAQRVVELVGGNGGLAWFTIVWPMPQVITQFSATFAYDDPSQAIQVTSDPDHPLFARSYNGSPLWAGVGAAPQPTAFVAGTNETHTQQPSSVVSFPGNGDALVAAGASYQTSLQATFPVITIGSVGPYGTAPNAPAILNVSSSAGMISALESSGVTGIQPTSGQLARYVAPNSATNETELATALAATANAFAQGAAATVVIPAYLDDPHGAFANGNPFVAAHATSTAMALDAFYRDLAAVAEPACGTGHGPLSMADNTVLLVVGDTPKDSYVSSGWPDGTAGNGNYFYVRSNGFLKPGWFGQFTAADARDTFDPQTGDLDAGDLETAADTQAAQAAALYAITRGNLAEVTAITTAEFTGEIAH